MRLLIATPMHGGECVNVYSASSLLMQEQLIKAGIGFRYQYANGSSLIAEARTIIANDFLKTDCTHLVFIDADGGWEVDGVMRMLAFAGQREYAIIGAPFVRKKINWERIKQAVLDNPAIDPNVLPAVGGEFCFQIMGEGGGDLGQPFEVPEIGAGFTVIQRRVFEAMIPHVKAYERGSMREFFTTGVDPGKDHYVGEDYGFCRLWRRLGGKVWLAPWVQTVHVGQMAFPADIPALVEAGVPIPVNVIKS